MKLTNRQLIDLWREEEIELDGVKLTLHEVGDWEVDGKYQTLDVIITDGERFYCGYISRSGSPFSDYEYEDYGVADVHQVRKVTKTVEVWEAGK